MASYARRFIRHNVRCVGGWCATTPEHIRQIKMAVRGLPAGARPGAADGAAESRPAPRFAAPSVERAPVAREAKSRLARSLAEGRFVVAVELLPPRGYDCRPVLDRARALRTCSVDAVSIPDGFRGGAHISALSLAVLIEQ